MHHPITWTEAGTPVSTTFDDPFFTGGAEESAHVFFAGNTLPERLRDGFQVAELGFGTGLNLVMLARLWAETGKAGRLRFASFEAYPMAADDMERALAPFDFPESADLVAAWRASSGARRQFALGCVDVEVFIDDARKSLPQWQGRADAWFLDGFAPARNPDLWGEELMGEVARHMQPAGTLATYTAAGHVRRALEAAGLIVERIPGFGRKKHMTRAYLPPRSGGSNLPKS